MPIILPPENPYKNMDPEIMEAIKDMKSKIPYEGKTLDEAIKELNFWKGIEDQADIVVNMEVKIEMHKK